MAKPRTTSRYSNLNAPDRAWMAGLVPGIPGEKVWLDEAGRKGWWTLNTGNAPAGDPMQGLYVQSDTSGFHYARVWDGIHGQPEWFGCRPDDPAYDCVPALNACIALCKITMLRAVDYWTQQEWAITTSHRKVVGLPGPADTGYGSGTKIVLTGAAAAAGITILRVGLLSEPAGGVLSGVRNVHVYGVTLLRSYESFRPAPPATGKIDDCDKAMVVQYTYECRFEQIRTYGSRIGFQGRGVCNGDFIDCHYNGYNGDSSSPPNDFRVGFLLGGAVPIFGFAGANASCRVVRCDAVVGSGINPTGMLLWGYFVDNFIDDFETAQVMHGICIDGTDLSGDNTNIAGRGVMIGSAAGHVDLRIHRSTLDQCSGSCITITNTNNSGAIEISDTYGVPIGDALGINLFRSLAAITVRGGMLFQGGGACRGFFANESGNFFVYGLKIRDFWLPFYALECGVFSADPQIYNVGTHADGAAIVLDGHCWRAAIKGSVAGSAAMFSMGVNVGTGVEFVSIDTTAHNPGAFIAVDAQYKVRWGGATDCRTEPLFTAAKNILLGVVD